MALLTSEFGISVAFDIPLAHFGFRSTNLVLNNQFATPGAGGTDVFANWVEDEDGTCIILQAANPVSDWETAGTNSVSFRSYDPNNLGTRDGHIYQSISVASGTAYRLTFYSRVSGQGTTEAQGRFAIYDVDNAKWIISRRNTGLFSSQNWGQTSIYFNAPLGCNTIYLYFYQNISTAEELGGTRVYYANVAINGRTPVTRAPVPAWGGSGSLGSYRHTNSVNVGYDNMQLTTVGNEDYIGDWLENGLGRRAITSYGGTIVWEGFVNEVSARLGASTITIGPLLGIVNRGQMVYKGVNFNVTPAVTIPGGAVKSEWFDHVESQGKFGVFEGKITGGEGLADEMSQLLRTIVASTAWPDLSQNLNIGGGSELSITVSCLGYGHMLDKFFYTQTGEAGYYTITEKFLDVLASDPNNIFTVGNTLIAENTTEVEKYEDSDRSALAILKDLAALGDEDYNRYVFGVFANRRVIYWNTIEREVKYFMSLRENRVRTGNRAIVQPWEIVPGEWLNIHDIIPGRQSLGTDFREDPSMLFIESATYSAPYTISLSGGRASKFKQKIESLGLGGF